jgi:hypothetical protein
VRELFGYLGFMIFEVEILIKVNFLVLYGQNFVVEKKFMVMFVIVVVNINFPVAVYILSR